jgi:hypothetical protein
VRYLNWDGSQWNWNYNWLDDGWNDGRPAALARNSFHFPVSNYSNGVLFWKAGHSTPRAFCHFGYVRGSFIILAKKPPIPYTVYTHLN